jgi:hypothetical protein
MMQFMKRSSDWAQSQLSEWALFDARQVLAIALALGALLFYAHLSSG